MTPVTPAASISDAPSNKQNPVTPTAINMYPTVFFIRPPPPPLIAPLCLRLPPSQPTNGRTGAQRQEAREGRTHELFVQSHVTTVALGWHRAPRRSPAIPPI